MNRFVIADPSKCIGCRGCEVACALAHLREDGTVLTRQSFLPRITVVRAGTVTTAMTCRHCDDAPCAKACPANAIIFDRDTVQVVQSRCIGCKSCVLACPYGAMNVVSVSVPAEPGKLFAANQTKAEAQKCDLCINRAEGQACVAACPTQALVLVDTPVVVATLKSRREQAAQS
jgi:electron transport protein HydN